MGTFSEPPPLDWRPCIDHDDYLWSEEETDIFKQMQRDLSKAKRDEIDQLARELMKDGYE